MRRPLEFTAVVALDADTLPQFRASWPTWRRQKPALVDLNWLFIVDARAHPGGWWRRELDILSVPPYRLVLWAWPQADDDDVMDVRAGADGRAAGPPTQHERMQTALLRIPPACCRSTHWIVLDPAAVATGPQSWLDPAWFGRLEHPVLVGSPGEPRDDELANLTAWADHHRDTILRPPVLQKGQVPPKPCPPLADWLMVVEAGFGRLASQLCRGRLPGARWGSYLWFLANRLGATVRPVEWEKVGWQAPDRTTRNEQK